MAQPHSYSETIESLLIDLLRLTSEAGAKDLAVETIKCVLLARLATVEAECAIRSCLSASAAESASTPTPSLALTFAELQTLEEATVQGVPEKLN
jgi:hypothetical protein